MQSIGNRKDLEPGVRPLLALNDTLLSKSLFIMQQGPIAKVLVHLLVTIHAAKERLLKGNYAKGHIKDKLGIQAER